MTWATLSAILERPNHVRRVIGFDTFDAGPMDAGQSANPNAVAASRRPTRVEEEEIAPERRSLRFVWSARGVFPRSTR